MHVDDSSDLTVPDRSSSLLNKAKVHQLTPLLPSLLLSRAEKEMMTAAHVDTVFSGTTMVLIIMQGMAAMETRVTSTP